MLQARRRVLSNRADVEHLWSPLLASLSRHRHTYVSTQVYAQSQARVVPQITMANLNSGA